MHTIFFLNLLVLEKNRPLSPPSVVSGKKKQKNPTEWEHMPLLHARRDRPSQSQRANPDLVRVRHDSFFSMRKNALFLVHTVLGCVQEEPGPTRGMQQKLQAGP